MASPVLMGVAESMIINKTLVSQDRETRRSTSAGTRRGIYSSMLAQNASCGRRKMVEPCPYVSHDGWSTHRREVWSDTRVISLIAFESHICGSGLRQRTTGMRGGAAGGRQWRPNGRTKRWSHRRLNPPLCLSRVCGVPRPHLPPMRPHSRLGMGWRRPPASWRASSGEWRRSRPQNARKVRCHACPSHLISSKCSEICARSFLGQRRSRVDDLGVHPHLGIARNLGRCVCRHANAAHAREAPRRERARADPPTHRSDFVQVF